MAEGPRSTEPRKRRGGLGRGLGALIPEAPEPTPVPESPLDVIFPERTERSSAQLRRGGSMRDLLGPPQSASNVSRETKKRVSGGKSRTQAPAEGADSAQGAPPLVSRDGTASGIFLDVDSDVSRETSEQQGQGSYPTGELPPRKAKAVSGPAHTIRPEVPGGASTSNVSRETISSEELVPVPGTTYAAIPVEWIIPNLRQPRTVFEQSDLDELAGSVGTLGVLQPVVVRPLTAEVLDDPAQKQRLVEDAAVYPEARYELVMGERRWRAAALAGLQSVPAIIRNTEPDEMLREALVENLHRVQLNPLEEAAAYSQLLEDFGYTQAELAVAVSKSRPQVANTLRLLRLPPAVQERVAAEVLSAGHARALLGLEDPHTMEELAERIVREGLSVRSTEELVRAASGTKPQPTGVRPQASAQAAAIAQHVSEVLDTSVKVTQGKHRGRLIVEFADEADLERISAIIARAGAQ